MTDFRIGYLYALAPIHCGSQGDLGNILNIAREAHTDFPYIPGSSLRGSLRDEVEQQDSKAADRLFGQELRDGEQMGVHQVWFGDARLLWVPVRTLAKGNQSAFSWISCPSLLRDRALLTRQVCPDFGDEAVGNSAGEYMVADAKIHVRAASPEQISAMNIDTWPEHLNTSVKPILNKNCIVLPDSIFQVLVEHSLWTQIRNKIQTSQDGANAQGSAEVFWTDICIPRDAIFYFPWGYQVHPRQPISAEDCSIMHKTLTTLIQVGGQANVGRGWVQSWINSDQTPKLPEVSAIA